MAIVAVLGAAFSLREIEPNPCNRRIAVQLLEICHGLLQQQHTPVVAVQWEVDAALRESGRVVNGKLVVAGLSLEYEVIGQYDDGRYLGTKEVLEEALPFFGRHEATDFVGVANAFIHQQYLYLIARKHFKLMWRRVHGIGFDKQSTQWWCRSWWQFAFQTVRLALGLTHGHDGRQAKAS